MSTIEPSPAELEPVLPLPGEIEADLEGGESAVAVEGLKRFVLLTRLASARESLEQAVETDRLIKLSAEGPQILTPEQHELMLSSHPKHAADAEAVRDEETGEVSHYVYDPRGARLIRGFSVAPQSSDHVPVRLVERVTSRHRQDQVRKHRAAGRERWRINEVYGEKPGVPEPKEEDYPNGAAFRWAKMQHRLQKVDSAKVNDVGSEEHITRLYGDPEAGIRPERMRGSHRHSQVEAIGELHHLDEQIETLQGRLDRGESGDTFFGRMRANRIESLREKIRDLETKLYGAPLTPEVDIDVPEMHEAGEPTERAPQPDFIESMGRSLKDAIIREPYIDMVAIDKLTDEEREELSHSTDGLKMIGLYAPSDVLAGSTREQRQLMALTAEIRMRNLAPKPAADATAHLKPDFESYHARMVTSHSGDTKVVKIVGEAKPFEKKRYVYVEGSKVPVPADKIIGIKPGPARKRRGEGDRPDRPSRAPEVTNEVEIPAEYAHLFDLPSLVQLDIVIAQEIQDRAHAEKDDRGVDKLPPGVWEPLRDGTRDELIDQYIQTQIGDEDLPDDIYDELMRILAEVRNVREGKTRSRPRRS